MLEVVVMELVLVEEMVVGTLLVELVGEAEVVQLPRVERQVEGMVVRPLPISPMTSWEGSLQGHWLIILEGGTWNRFCRGVKSMDTYYLSI